jgi:pyridoxamine 5'-phosphate oxidase family protein
MSHFTAAEIEYLKGQRLGRLATVNAAGEPHVVPVGFHFNSELDTIDIGGRGNGTSKKYHDAAAGRAVAFVVDDIASGSPWKVRGIEVRGQAEALATGGQAMNAGFDPEMIRIRPRRIVAWGIETDPFQPNKRTVE